jgi:hypothetical protein
MKYLKPFNEELKPQVYRNAARAYKKMLKNEPKKAKQIGAEEKAMMLDQHADDFEEKLNLKKWEESVRKYSKYGEFEVEFSTGHPSVKPMTLSVYFDISSAVDMMIDSWADEGPDNRRISFDFAVGIVPKTIEDIDLIKKNFNSEFYNGFFWSLWIYIQYKVQDGVVSFEGVKVYDYDSSPKHSIIGIKSARNLKRLITNMFDQVFDYPSGYTDIPNMYDKINQSAIQDLEIGIDFGIDMDRIKKDLESTSPKSFFVL